MIDEHQLYVIVSPVVLSFSRVAVKCSYQTFLITSTVKVSCVHILRSAAMQYAPCRPWLMKGLAPALSWMLAMARDNYLLHFTVGEGQTSQIGTSDRWPAWFTALPLNVSHDVYI